MDTKHLAQLTNLGPTPQPLYTFEGTFTNILNAVIGLAGVTLFIFLIIGGFNYITAGGDPKKAESAKSTITSALYGVVFVALAYLILAIVARVTTVDSLLYFNIFRQ